MPHTQLELALQMSLQVEIPYLPQLPMGNPSELMIPSALDGLPGIGFEEDGAVEIDLAEWEKGRAALAERIDQALAGEGLSRFEPSAQAARAFRPFIWEVENRKLAFAKAQIAGPLTVRWVAKTSTGAPTSGVEGLDEQIYRLILVKSLALIRAIRQVNAVPVLFLDEPGLYALDPRSPKHLLALSELKLLVLALQREGAIVGIHCCSNTRWDAVLELGIDVLSIDVRLSLDALMDDPAGFDRFIASGAILSLGIIPTNLSTTYSVRELVDSVEASYRATLGDWPRAKEALGKALLTPACGLAMRTVADAERTFADLGKAQRALRAAIEA